jgi:hypothetical protein
MEQLRDVIVHLLRLAGPGGVNRTVLNKLVYFAELESWRRCGEPLTGASFYRFHYGAWAPDVKAVAESVPAYVEHRRILGVYQENRYRLRPEAPPPEISPQCAKILADVFARFGRKTAADIGPLSKATEPMLIAQEEGDMLDLSVVAPRRSKVQVRNSRLARASVNRDTSQRGTRHEIDERDQRELSAWSPARRAANALWASPEEASQR